MWVSIISALLPIAVKIIGSFVENKLKDSQLSDEFKTFVSRMQAKQASLAAARDDAQAQRDELNGK